MVCPTIGDFTLIVLLCEDVLSYLILNDLQQSNNFMTKFGQNSPFSSEIRHIIQVYCYPYFSTPMCRADIADHIDMHMTYVNHKFMPQIIDTLLMHSPECIIGRMAQLPYRVVHEI